jgi:eukaryotic-like serine/threonine-protein kinase
MFLAAADLPESERAAFLDDACKGQADLRADVEALLASMSTDEFMAAPAVNTVAPELEVDLSRFKPDEPGERIGPYKLLQQIGEGGFGIVWMAEQEKPVRRRVALKIIKVGMDTREVVARFEQERQALAMMEHPNIAKVFDAGSTPTGRPFFAMELVKGVKITEYCDEAQLSTAERLQLFVQVCSAIQHAHQKGIIHRDLKPSNVLVTMHDGVAVPKVIDFGVAKATLSQRLTDLTLFTQFEQMIGTPLYMAPEQAELSGLDIDTRSDIYSLGVLLYELLTGRTPFDPEKLMQAGFDEMRRVIKEEEPPKPSTVVSTMALEVRINVAKHRSAEEGKLISAIEGDLDWIVMKALEKDRNRRYESASAFARDIERHLGSEPVLARPPSASYRFARFVRRNRLIVGAAASVALALVTGAAFSTWSFLGERYQHQRADVARIAAEQQRSAAEAQRQRADEQTAIAKANAMQASEKESFARGLLYDADINLAQQALEQSNLWRARRLLDRHRPKQGQVDLRGWEWRLLWQQCLGDPFVVLNKHAARAFSVSFSADGHRLAVGYFDGRVELWDVQTKSRARVLEEGWTDLAEQGQKARVAFSPMGDALAATSGTGEVKWHDLATKQERVLCQVNGLVRDIAFSKDGARVVVLARLQESATIIETDSGRIVRTLDLPPGSDRHLNNARLSPDHERLFVTVGGMVGPGQFRAARLQCIRIADAKVLWEQPGDDPIERGNAGFSALDVSPDGKFLATATAFQGNKIRIWSAETGERLGTLQGHSGWCADLTFSPDGKMLASASKDQTVRFWETSTWREAAGPLRGNGDEVHAAAFAPDGQAFATGGRDGSVLLWDLRNRKPSGGHTLLKPDIIGARALPGGRQALVKDRFGKWALLDLKTLKEDELPFARENATWFVLPKFFAVQDQAKIFKLFELTESGPALKVVLPIAPSPDATIAFCAERRVIAWTTDSKTIRVTHLDEPEQREDLVSGEDTANPVRFTDDGNVLLAAGPDGVPRVWDLSTRQRVPSAEEYLSPLGLPILGKNAGYLQSDAIQRWLVRALAEPSSQTRPQAGSRELAGIHPKGRLSDFALSTDGHTLAASTANGEVTLYDAVGPKKIAQLQGRATAVWSLAFSQDGTRLAVSNDVLWDVATRQELLALPTVGAVPRQAEFSDDGNTLIVGNAGVIQFWRAPTWQEIEESERSGGGWRGSSP